MALATAPVFTESFQSQVDDLLMRICVELQLDKSRHDLAERSYEAVGRLLESHTLVSRLKPSIYPQGSVRLGTTVKPLLGDEYDLDLVCEFACRAGSFAQPVDALNLIERALRDSGVYALMVRRKNRCIRLNYVHKFHLDILPACKDGARGGTCIVVPDRKLSIWTPSNPIGYASWFNERSGEVLRRLIEKAAPIPAREQVQQKPPLKLSVQLWKRWRDLRYKSSPELAPISVVLSTLAGLTYRGEASVGEALRNILARTDELARTSNPRLIVLNPTNNDEDLSERWDARPTAYREFVNGVAEFYAEWRTLFQMRGTDKIARILERLFGEEISKRVIENQTREIEAARTRNELGIKKSSGIIAGAASSSVGRIPRNTFYGEDK